MIKKLDRMIEKFDRDRANLQLNSIIMKILMEEMPILKEKIRKFCRELRKAKYIIYIFSIAIFAVGLFFLTTALLTALPANNDWLKIVEGLGFGGASATSFISLMLLNPIKKIQDANSDASQAEMIFYCWELGIFLHIRAMDINDRDSIKEAAEKIKELTAEAISLLEEYTEIEIDEG